MEAGEYIVVFGAGGHARVVCDVVACAGRYRVRGLLERSAVERDMCGGGDLPILGSEEDLPALGIRRGLVAVGDERAREEAVRRILAIVPGFEFVSAVHPAATVAADVKLGCGTVIMAGAIVNPGTHIGAHCVVNTHASLDHDNQLGDFVHVAPGATTGGGVRIGRGTLLGLGAQVIQGIGIGEGSVVGAGSLVLRDLPSGVVAHGSPAEVVRTIGSQA